jgi:hypothetical protein
VIAYRGCRMEQAATARGQGVPNRPGGGGRCAENAKKMLFSGNKPKVLLKIKDLALSEPKNELLFQPKKPQSKQGIWPKVQDWTPCARLPYCHSERSGAERRISLWAFTPTTSRARCFAEFNLSGRARFFAEFTLSQLPRFFASLRMTGEGLSMTANGISMTDPKVEPEAGRQRCQFPVSAFWFLLLGAYLFPLEAS